jgi:DNA-3-methyladenine glycosylase II
MSAMAHEEKIKHLRRDRTLRKIIDRAKQLEHTWKEGSRPNHFKSLVRAIVNQQLSSKAADTIFKRFEALFAGAPSDRKPLRKNSSSKKFPTPEQVLKMPTAKLRKVGLSGMKVEFVKDLSRKILDGTVDFRAMKKWSDEEVIEHLVRVKGIGRWTAEMFLMFSLGRDDVFSYGDLALRKAMQRLYGLRANPTPKQAEKISAAWKPYRTLASRYLWRSLEIE